MHKDFTFVCPTEITAFGDRQPEFEKANCQVIAASCDNEFTHLAWVNTARSNGGLGPMKIPIVADFSKEIATKYGVLHTDGVPFRTSFIISPTGVLRQITMNDNPVGRNVDETLRLVKAYQYTDEHGEVCPANWQPGDKTMVADPKLSKAYFSTVADPGLPAAAGGLEEVSKRCTRLLVQMYNACVYVFIMI
jgi:peroxiredoxin (alkyl hydroperoxide reductase subunit C)